MVRGRVSLAAWQDIWLNEGFATWSQWLWQTRGSDDKLRKIFKSYFGSNLEFFGYRHFWKLPPGAPGPKKLFSAAVYFRGGLTLEALREKVGDAAFYSILRDWVAQHRYGNGTTRQFIALAEADVRRLARALLRPLAVRAAQADGLVALAQDVLDPPGGMRTYVRVVGRIDPAR